MKDKDIILFLDFDGVTHPITGAAPFDPQCMKHLETIISEYSNIRIVISSSWREEHTLEALIEKLGNIIGARVTGITPVIDDPFLHYVRFHEVMKYLEDNNLTKHHWVALDDTPGFYGDQDNVIYTDPRTGFSEESRYKLKMYLNTISF